MGHFENELRSTLSQQVTSSSFFSVVWKSEPCILKVYKALGMRPKHPGWSWQGPWSGHFPYLLSTDGSATSAPKVGPSIKYDLKGQARGNSAMRRHC